MTEAYLQDQFKARLKDLPGSSATRAAREDAMAAFRAAGYPTRKLEDWRYTDLKPIATGQFDPIPESPSQDAAARAQQLVDELDLTSGYPPLVFVDGHPVSGHEAPQPPDGLEILSLAEAWDNAAKTAAEIKLDERPLAALNTAFAANGICLRVASGAQIAQPIHLVFVASEQPSLAPQPRIAIDLGPDSTLRVTQHFLGAGEHSGWTNLVTQISQGPRSKLTLYRLQQHGEAHLHTELLKAELADDANLELGYIDLGGKLVRNDVQVNLAKPGARCDLFGVFMAAEGQHVDNHIRVDHSAPRTISRETFRGIIGDRGRGVFNGKVVVHKGAQKIDATQSSDNLLLSDRGEINTKPELEIYADDVKCSHGATVGQLDEDQLFYMRSRGVDEATARGLLTFAFANEILQRLDMPEIRERIARTVLAHLPGQQQWDELL
jgi:Fe-S cluster assembly protein SufD